MIHLKSSLLIGTAVTSLVTFAVPALAQNSNSSGLETVIVTGTRVQGMTAADSAAPLTVLGTDALTHGTGTTDLRAALAQMVPSFTAEQRGGDLGNLTLTAALRGISPNDTLVLVNGHRRHGTANLQVSATRFTAGGAAPDISLIPEGAIDHVEVLLDGAAAQYGTDAIGGVVNIILKKNSSGGNFSASAGETYAREGQAYDMSLNMGMPLFDKGFINLTVDKKFQGFTQLGGADTRLINATGGLVPTGVIGPANPVTGVVPCSLGNCLLPSSLAGLYRYPRSNPGSGDAEYQLTTAELNAGYDISDNIHLYTTGTYGQRVGLSHEGNRLPNQTLATPGSNQPCSAANPQGYNTAQTAGGTPACAVGFGITPTTVGTRPIAGTSFNAGGMPTGLNAAGQVISTGQVGTVFTPGELIFFPEGAVTEEVIKENDYQYNAGVTFGLAGWQLDANAGYGKDIVNVYTWGSADHSLYTDTHFTPSSFYDGSFTASEFMGTIDATKQYNVGLASPLTVALGLEAREDTYRLESGEPASYYKEGPQSFPGFPPSDASNHSRKNYAGYVDFAVAPIEALQLDIAGRAEHYTDFGDAQIGKITARYDFSPQWAVRGTLSTGFRAPTLAEEYYTATNVSPASATLQLPADSAAAKVLGLPNLKPEISTQYSVGIVAHPLEDLSVTVDAYSITLGDRIVASSKVYSQGGAINTALVNSAIAVAGNVLDPTATQNAVTAYTNGLDTLTQGLDLTANYPTDFGDYGAMNWTLAGNYNTTSISRVAPVPAVLLASNPGATFFTPLTLYNFVHSTPNIKIGLTADWTLDEWGITARDTFYGPDHSLSSISGGPPYYTSGQAAVGLFDLEVRYNFTSAFEFAVGGNNLFNVKPDIVPYISLTPNASGMVQASNTSNLTDDPASTVFNPDGGYYYARVTLKF